MVLHGIRRRMEHKRNVFYLFGLTCTISTHECRYFVCRAIFLSCGVFRDLYVQRAELVMGWHSVPFLTFLGLKTSTKRRCRGSYFDRHRVKHVCHWFTHKTKPGNCIKNTRAEEVQQKQKHAKEKVIKSRTRRACVQGGTNMGKVYHIWSRCPHASHPHYYFLIICADCENCTHLMHHILFIFRVVVCTRGSLLLTTSFF